MNWIIGKTVTGVQTSNLEANRATSVTIFFDDGSEISFSELWCDNPGWGGIDITEKMSSNVGIQRLRAFLARSPLE
jgi:hypothetical protein